MNDQDKASRKHFKRGSGCFTCRCCGKQTRDTGNDEGSCLLCLACYESAARGARVPIGP